MKNPYVQCPSVLEEAAMKLQQDHDRCGVISFHASLENEIKFCMK